ncbi:MAG: hypothetical protein KKH72_10180 [Alphaproteobacteria bacterium]|nr:hypothetical protein [Alphaproteobacteria bacterium]
MSFLARDPIGSGEDAPAHQPTGSLVERRFIPGMQHFSGHDGASHALKNGEMLGSRGLVRPVDVAAWTAMQVDTKQNDWQALHSPQKQCVAHRIKAWRRDL